MDLNFDDATLEFQAEVREFLAGNKDSFPTKSYDTADGFEQHRRWDKVLYDAGLSVITWPEKYGGRDASLLQWVVYEEEYFRAGAPGRASANGTSMLAPTLFAHGTEEQLDRVLPKMASGEEIWAQAWSEPESGSDLASLRSTANDDTGRLSRRRLVNRPLCAFRRILRRRRGLWFGRHHLWHFRRRRHDRRRLRLGRDFLNRLVGDLCHAACVRPCPAAERDHHRRDVAGSRRSPARRHDRNGANQDDVREK